MESDWLTRVLFRCRRCSLPPNVNSLSGFLGQCAILFIKVIIIVEALLLLLREEQANEQKKETFIMSTHIGKRTQFESSFCAIWIEMILMRRSSKSCLFEIRKLCKVFLVQAELWAETDENIKISSNRDDCIKFSLTRSSCNCWHFYHDALLSDIYFCRKLNSCVRSLSRHFTILSLISSWAWQEVVAFLTMISRQVATRSVDKFIARLSFQHLPDCCVSNEHCWLIDVSSTLPLETAPLFMISSATLHFQFPKARSLKPKVWSDSFRA